MQARDFRSLKDFGSLTNINTKIERKPLTSEEISVIVDNLDPIDYEKMEMLAKLPQGERWLVMVRKSKEIRTDLRNKLRRDFPVANSPFCVWTLCGYDSPAKRE